MKDFRQFRGVQEVEFASETENNGKNVTVILGEIGRGKTGLFRAVVFALYGDRRLSQDEEAEQKELYLVNSAAMEDTKIYGRPVEAYVELIFRHKGELYTIKRSLLGIFDRDERIEQIGSVVLSHTKSDGNTLPINDPEKIQKTINNILDKNVKEYFLFDGEKIQRLTMASIEQRKEVAKGIKNLLNVDDLEKAIKALHRLTKELNTELRKRATGEHAKILHQQNQLEEKRNTLKARLEEIEGEYTLLNIEKKKIDKLLEEYKEIFHLLKERKVAETQLKSQEEQTGNFLSEMRARTAKASQLLISGTIDYVFNSIDQKKQRGEIPSEIRKDLIERILDIDRKCICDRSVLPGTPEHNALIRWKNKVSDVELEDSALEIWRSLSSIKSYREDISGVVETLLQRYAVCRNDIEKLRKKIENINEQIGASERKDAADLEKTRENIEKKQIRNEAERMTTKSELDSVESEYARLSEQRKILEKEENIRNELSQRASLAEDTYKALQEVYNGFTEEIKGRIAVEANKYFVQLLDKEGRETLKQILVNTDYSLQILDRWGKPFLANISAGQRQIMSISFIAALAKVASMDSILEMPLFMDTPFGRLSNEPRKNLINQIPNYCAQWILLATDTEFRKQEASLLREGKRWGKFYVLRSEGPGVTIIQERDIGEAQSLLHENMGEN
jgi:DNA sulfur modification protein DndD